jgi:hypothetical protein
MVLVHRSVSRIVSPAHTPAFSVPDTRPSWSILTVRKQVSILLSWNAGGGYSLHQTLPEPSKLSHDPGHLAM